MLFLRGERLFSEILKLWIIMNNSNTKPGVFLQFSVCNTTNLAAFLLWIPSTIPCQEKQFLLMYFLGETILQNTNCERLICEREENCRLNHWVNVLQENPPNDNELFCFSCHLHDINMSFRWGKCLYSSFSHTPAPTHYRIFLFHLLKCWQVHCSRHRQVSSRKTSNLGHQAACSIFASSCQEKISGCVFITALMKRGRRVWQGPRESCFAKIPGGVPDQRKMERSETSVQHLCYPWEGRKIFWKGKFSRASFLSSRYPTLYFSFRQHHSFEVQHGEVSSYQTEEGW